MGMGDGMTALVTGGAQRLGRAMVLELARRGLDVAVHYHGSQDAAEETAQDARAFGIRAACFRADLLDWSQTEALIPQIGAAMGPLSVLVNNASIFEYDRIGTITRDSWDRHIGSNLRAPLQLIQAFAAQAAPEDRSEGEARATGLVVNIADQRVLKPTPEFTTYSLAKSALWALTRSAAQGLAPAIRVNAIGPGPTLRGARQSQAHFDAQRGATILERGADPEDIAAALGYLLDAKAVTGQLICVDGGQHLAWQTPDILGVE